MVTNVLRNEAYNIMGGICKGSGILVFAGLVGLIINPGNNESKYKIIIIIFIICKL